VGRKLHLLFVAACAPRPHAWQHGSFVHDMARALHQDGHDVTVLVPVRVFPDSRLASALKQPLRLGPLLHAFREWTRLWRGARGTRVRDGIRYHYRRFCTWPRTSRGARNGEALAASLACWWPGVEAKLPARPDAVVGHFLDMAPLVHALGERTGACRVLFAHECPVGLAAPCLAPWLLDSISRLDLLLTNSQWNLEALNAAGIQAARNAWASPGVTHLLDGARSGPPPLRDVLKLVYVARFAANKNHDAIVEAVEAWTREDRKPAIRMTFLGDHGASRPALERRLAASGYGDHFDVRTYETGDAFVGVLSASHAFLSTSRYESFGMALLEAVCAGLPLISAGSAGFVHALQTAGHAVVEIDPECVESISAGIAQLTNDYAAAVEQARVRQQYAREIYTWRGFSEAFSAAVSAACDARRAGREPC